MFQKGKQKNGKTKKAAALKGGNRSTKEERRESLLDARIQRIWSAHVEAIFSGSLQLSRTQEKYWQLRTTKLSYWDATSYGVVACQALLPGAVACTYPATAMLRAHAERFFPHLEIYWYGLIDIEGNHERLVAVPAIERLQYVSSKGISALGPFANEPGPTENVNCFMRMSSRKKTFRPGDSLDFELVVGRNSVVDQGDKILQYYGPHYPRTYKINQQACLEFAALNECGEQYFVT